MASKRFSDLVNFSKNLDFAGLVDGVDLHKEVVSSTKDQVITGQKLFHNNTYIKQLSVGNMTAHGLIDGINITYLDEELIKLSGDRVVREELKSSNPMYLLTETGQFQD